jgi:hypothetical protein
VSKNEWVERRMEKMTSAIKTFPFLSIDRAQTARFMDHVGCELGGVEGTAMPGLGLHGVAVRLPNSRKQAARNTGRRRLTGRA